MQNLSSMGILHTSVYRKFTYLILSGLIVFLAANTAQAVPSTPGSYYGGPSKEDAKPIKAVVEGQVITQSTQDVGRDILSDETKYEQKGQIISDQQIVDVIISGNERIASQSVLSYADINIGDIITANTSNDVLKRLYGTGLFADISVLFEDNILLIEVSENPIISRISFEGNRDVKDEVLEKEIFLRPRLAYTRGAVQQDTQRIVTIYRRSGRFSTQVTPKIIPLSDNRVNLVFEINEGDITRVARINFIGNKNFSDSALLDAISTREERWYKFFSTDDIYDPDRLLYDSELLRLFYLNNGYIDFKIISTSADLSPNQDKFYLTFVIEEGQRYQINDVAVQADIEELRDVDFTASVFTKSGVWYNAQDIGSSIDALSDQAGLYGYAFVDVEPIITRPEDKPRYVNIIYKIAEGEKIYVEKVNINGNLRTQDQVIRRELLLYGGDAFNTAKMRRSKRMLERLGLFAKVDIRNSPGSQFDQTIINVDVADQATGSLSVGGGYSTSDGALGRIGIRERNFLGRGQDVNLNFSLSQRTQNIELGFTEPYFLDRKLSAGFTAYMIDRDYRVESGFDEKTIGGNLRFGYWLFRDFRQSWRYALYSKEITNLAKDTSRYIKSQRGKRVTSSLTHSISYDKRNSVVDPNDGYYASLSTTFAGIGGEAKYLEISGAAKYYYPLRPGWTSSVTLTGGYILGLLGKKVRLSDRFFVGGDDFRGFRISGIGPRDISTSDALGANSYYIAQFEQGFPLGLPKELGIEGRVFFDIGSAFSVSIDTSKMTKEEIEMANKNIRDDHSIRSSAGAGIAWRSPFGSIRIYYAKAIMKENYDITEDIRFTFGTRF